MSKQVDQVSPSSSSSLQQIDKGQTQLNKHLQNAEQPKRNKSERIKHKRQLKQLNQSQQADVCRIYNQSSSEHKQSKLHKKTGKSRQKQPIQCLSFSEEQSEISEVLRPKAQASFSKAKKSKTPQTTLKRKQSKQKSRRANNQKRRTSLDSSNPIQLRDRKTRKQNYSEYLKQSKRIHKHQTINQDKLLKQLQLCSYYESLVISHVEQSVKNGVYMCFVVRLKNRQAVLVRERDMRQYFPRKLNEYYQRILQRVGKSTEAIDFTVI